MCQFHEIKNNSTKKNNLWWEKAPWLISYVYQGHGESMANGVCTSNLFAPLIPSPLSWSPKSQWRVGNLWTRVDVFTNTCDIHSILLDCGAQWSHRACSNGHCFNCFGFNISIFHFLFSWLFPHNATIFFTWTQRCKRCEPNWVYTNSLLNSPPSCDHSPHCSDTIWHFLQTGS